MNVAAFVSPPTILQILRNESCKFMVYSDVVFYSAKLNRTITVPYGFKTDLASIPKFLRDRIDVNGLHREAAILHDYGCDYGETLGLTQKQVDELLLEAMEVLNVSKIERGLIFYGVRLYQSTKKYNPFAE